MDLKKYSILVVDDDVDVLTAVRLLLKPSVGAVMTEKRPENLTSLLKEQRFDVVLLDMNFNSTVNTGNEGLFWLKKIKELQPGTNVIMITAYGDVDLAMRSVKEGAADFMLKPWDNKKLVAAIEMALKGSGAKAQQQELRDSDIIGRSEAMKEVFYKLDKVAPTDANILVLGENGTGKDLIAKALHEKSLRAGKPFVKVDLGALTDSLFESELFGHKKGAFTDAREDRVGRLEAANGGTLFLDEIGNTTLQQQAKLLTALQNRQITRLGSNQPISIDVRLICATNATLADLANETRFRKDFIYRINTIDINVPPLRKRGDDVVLLAQHFLRVYTQKYLRKGVELGRDAIGKLKAWPWPGNVRELQYVMERAVIMAEGSTLLANDLVFSPIEQTVAADPETSKLTDLERNTIVRVIEKNGGNITKAAKELGITRTALYRRLDKHDI